MKTRAGTEVQRVAQAAETLDGRLNRLRQLMDQLADRYLTLSMALHDEHEAELWKKVRSTDGKTRSTEEEFWENTLGLKRRTAYQLISIGRMLSKVDAPDEVSKVLVGVGLHKTDILVPALERVPTLAEAQKWADVARTHSREALREKVSKALDRPAHAAGEPGDRLRTYVINAMPNGEARQLAEAFFAAGAQQITTQNAVTIMIAGFQECLGTWRTHGPKDASA